MKQIKVIYIFVLFTIFSSSITYANQTYSFEEIMGMMEGADIRYERVGHYSNIPFKLEKKGKTWRLTQMKNKKRGTIVSAGDNKIKLKGFGSRWTIKGTWNFKKVGELCRIDHTLKDSTGREPMNMVWECK